MLPLQSKAHAQIIGDRAWATAEHAPRGPRAEAAMHGLRPGRRSRSDGEPVESGCLCGRRSLTSPDGYGAVVATSGAQWRLMQAKHSGMTVRARTGGQQSVVRSLEWLEAEYLRFKRVAGKT
jgi:hypothetical protein